jgi:hypothetical protein
MNISSKPFGPRSVARVCREPCGIVQFEVDGLPAKVTNRGIQRHDQQSPNNEHRAGNSYNTTVNLSPLSLPDAAGGRPERVDLPERVAHHAIKVLRLRCGDALTLFNGAGGEYRARIIGIERERVSVECLEWLATERESPLSITLVQALQAGEKMDLTVQKAVELGRRPHRPGDLEAQCAASRRRARPAPTGALARRRRRSLRTVRAQPVAGSGGFPRASKTGWREARERGGLRLMLAPAAGCSLAKLPPVGRRRS